MIKIKTQLKKIGLWKGIGWNKAFHIQSTWALNQKDFHPVLVSTYFFHRALNVSAHQNIITRYFLQLRNNTIDPLLWVRWRVIAFFIIDFCILIEKECMAVSRIPSHNEISVAFWLFCYKISLVWHFIFQCVFKAYRFMDFHLLSSNKKSQRLQQSVLLFNDLYKVRYRVIRWNHILTQSQRLRWYCKAHFIPA